MTLTDARKILESIKPDNELVKEALETVIQTLPEQSNKASTEDRFNELRCVLKSVYGKDPFETRSRETTTVLLRTCVYYRMRQEGYSLNGIARAAGYDHATIHVNCKRFADYLSANDWIATNTWNKFIKYVST